MYIKFYFIKLFLIVLLLSTGMANKANAQLQVNISNVYNLTTGAYDSPASAGDILVYTFITTNTSNTNVTGCRFYNNIPAGTSYVTGSTSLNDLPVPDVNGKMPYVGSGGLINPLAWDPGILGAGTFAKVAYQVKVTANAGKISNSATCEATSSGVSIIQKSGIIFTPLLSDPGCTAVYQSTTNTASGTSGLYNNIRTVSTENGVGGTTIFAGASGPCYNAITGASLPAGSVMTNVAALAYDRNSNRIYFVNNVVGTAQDLCYVDLGVSPVAVKKYVGYPLETATGNGYNINRMTFAVDGYGYAVTSNALDLIRFSINASTGLPVISRLGKLVNNDALNGSNNVLAEAGGDIFSDGSGKLYLVVNSGKMYRIDPATRISTYIGPISPVPSGYSNSVATDSAGNIYIGGLYQNVYKVNLSTMKAASITSGTANVWTNGDYTSCTFPVLQSAIQVNTTYRNTSGNAHVASGDTIEYTIEVINTGNLNAAGLRLYNAIPAYSYYVAASTTMNGTTVADEAQLTMPFSLSGGKLISSPGESAGLIAPGDANKVVIKYRIITEPLKTICNQATATLFDVNGNLTTYSDDPVQPGNLDATCFWSDSARVITQGARIATTANTQLSAKGTVQPNPFVTALNLQLQLNTAAAVKVRLFDLYGRTVFTTSQKLAKGFQSLHINVPAGLTPGIYVLEITDGNNQLLQKKLLKQ